MVEDRTKTSSDQKTRSRARRLEIFDRIRLQVTTSPINVKMITRGKNGIGIDIELDGLWAWRLISRLFDLDEL